MIIRAVCPLDTPIQHIHYSYEKDLLAANLLSASQLGGAGIYQTIRPEI